MATRKPLVLDGNAAREAAGVDEVETPRLRATSAYTPTKTVAYASTVILDCVESNVFEVSVLTGDVTALTLNNAGAGQTVNIRFAQDAIGGRTIAVPGGAKVAGDLPTAAGAVAWLMLIYSNAGARWEGYWNEVPA